TVFLYDAVAKSGAGKNIKTLAIIGFIFVAIALYLMRSWAHFEYRSYLIHIGAMFGTIMAFNVWFRIWPNQKKIITAVKNGEAPDAGVVATAGARSRHNTYLSLPLIWAMLNFHTTYFAGANLGIPGGWARTPLRVITPLGGNIIWKCYRRAEKVKVFKQPPLRLPSNRKVASGSRSFAADKSVGATLHKRQCRPKGDEIN